MGKGDALADLLYALQQIGFKPVRGAHPEGVVVPSLDNAKTFVANHADIYELGATLTEK